MYLRLTFDSIKQKKQRLELFFKMEANSMQNREIELSNPPVLYEDETAAAAASISLSSNNEPESPEPSIHVNNSLTVFFFCILN